MHEETELVSEQRRIELEKCQAKAIKMIIKLYTPEGEWDQAELIE